MQMNETREIAAPPAQVWAALFDPDVLRQCVPGCEELTGSAKDGFDAIVIQKVGPVKARFKGAIALSDISEGEAATLTGEGKGGAAGFARGAARLRLEPAGEGTLLHYDVEAKVGGKLAQLGSRIIDGFARKLADQYFERFQQAVEGPGAENAQPIDTLGDAPGDSAEAEPAADGKAQKGWIKRLVGR